MFGDFFGLGPTMAANDGVANEVLGSLPLAGASRRVRVAENNGALPQDRIHLMYNHFHNALEADASATVPDPAVRMLSVDRYTLGAEKTFGDGRWSVEVRMPFTGDSEFATSMFALSGGEIGNLAVIVKRLLYQSESFAFCAGVTVDTPTGSDAHARFNLTEITMHNDAVYVSPYFGLLWSPSERFFAHGFLQVEVPCNGNRVDHFAPGFGGDTFGKLNDQTLLYLDVGGGYWLYQAPAFNYFTGLAAVLELHYTSTLQNADFVGGTDFWPFPIQTYGFSNFLDRVDVLDLTVGLHLDLTRMTRCRVAGVFPLKSELDRVFDAEVLVQMERRF
jgi:hypothetical protein